MPKDTFYFSHDYNARNDPKLIRVQVKHGMAGLGIYWSIVEMLYEENGEIPIDYDNLTFVLRHDTNVIRSIVNDFDLFIFCEGMLSSASVLKRIAFRNEKSKKARESVNKRWNKQKEHNKDTDVSKKDTDVSKNDTIKERKEKESKVNESKKEEEEISPHETPVLKNSLHTNNKSMLTKSETLENLKTEQTWKEVLCMNNSVDMTFLEKDLQKFISDQEKKGQFPRVYRETKEHYSNRLEKYTKSLKETEVKKSTMVRL